jgi:peptidoglycan/xylan/chitin deacetylase (PgdA/CDA1 family)
MRSERLRLSGYFLLILLAFLPFRSFSQRSMAFTFDDLPSVSTWYTTPTGQDTLTKLLLGHLRQYRVRATGFVIGDARNPLLRQWQDAGMELGNHTYRHTDFHHVPSAEHLEDIRREHQSLVSAGYKPRYFRSPYLHRGHSVARQDSLKALLKELGYREAPTSIDNADYRFSAVYDKALLAGDTAAARRIGTQFVEYLLRCITYYDAQGQALTGRSVSHILLLHANTLNAHWLGVLLGRLQARGVQFISLDQALTDPVYASPDTYTGKGGISWIHRWALTQGKKGAFFDGEPEVPAGL